MRHVVILAGDPIAGESAIRTIRFAVKDSLARTPQEPMRQRCPAPP